MKIALVHDFMKEFGGAERVLRVLSEMYSQVPIYTAFKVSGSSCDKEFADRKIIESSFGWLIKSFNLYSPLRFLVPLIWRSIDLSSYDLVITSCSSYFARGFKVSPKTCVVAYCHTPPRFLYGYETSINLQRFWIVRVYAVIVNHFLRIFDFWSSQRVDKWIVNSENVKRRVWKFYRKEAEVVYPPIDVEKIIRESEGVKKQDYFLIVSRLVGAKGLVEAAKAARQTGFKLKIVGESVGFSQIEKQLRKIREVELLGRVNDKRLGELYAGAKGFIALARDEDFGITPVEAMASGTPVIAFNGGGFKETVVEGVTGLLINNTDTETLELAMKKFESKKWNRAELVEQARKFSRDNFVKKIRKIIDKMVVDEK
ncbi:MAG: Glycosyltransferase [Candidatus Collierbacteria bacterium GW2011_GWB1_45_35]|uniref:Glycosyltransferase n=2 Tax=Candidatus Collieribacteriota TaxID=1752725 RepID=A0A0G1N153_9BACT|nr:MAG: Glycosyltransferase [Microgenomates group bacterium GW2011_GWC1_44_23]KKT86782.1 MAG: Glycosyltransferase [Candidatus Collierbacteria bacterium GW2011_GWA2_44_99]KKT95591.1 MAG: Glycosyltransferase [Candidatus Collierbacteria bacterium GW2011_GWA1_45_15]KKU00509.1 MAG: Glycosyltransferase [Candidatus Collierbacteria bacterium GW2011_GWB2_45_17]KKU05609.1 MAG: Glycosyltransferase [Candidatus Collierbacteria bacterium GW2011_GWB1_45_35]KKU08222.1 MAG: Glycosyltransferase [Candidatus Coll